MIITTKGTFFYHTGWSGGILTGNLIDWSITEKTAWYGVDVKLFWSNVYMRYLPFEGGDLRGVNWY